MREWRKANPVDHKAGQRRCHLRKQFGMTPADFDALLAGQGGVCGICRGALADSRGFHPHVDHWHDTGRVRGILCLKCNVGLGAFGDDPERLGQALRYLLNA